MTKQLYPLKFQPILKERIWGGLKLKTHLNKSSELRRIGESWEISDVDGDTSVVINGSFKGHTLRELLKNYKSELLGKKNYDVFKNKFPLLIKFIDAKKDLSIQLHPNDELAKKRHNSFGKTEMWYVMQADQDANLIVGFNQKMTQEKYVEHLETKKLPEILNFEKVKEGDAYFIEVGRVHAIGRGVMLAEIQQTSDITYRIYDWDRVDEKGNERQLHNDLALDAIDYNMKDNFKVGYSSEHNESNSMVNCPYFKTNFLPLKGTLKKQNDKDSFLIYICVAGELKVTTKNYSTNIKMGETVLIPACTEEYDLSSENAKLLEVYV